MLHRTHEGKSVLGVAHLISTIQRGQLKSSLQIVMVFLNFGFALLGHSFENGAPFRCHASDGLIENTIVHFIEITMSSTVEDALSETLNDDRKLNQRSLRQFISHSLTQPRAGPGDLSAISRAVWAPKVVLQPSITASFSGFLGNSQHWSGRTFMGILRHGVPASIVWFDRNGWWSVTVIYWINIWILTAKQPTINTAIKTAPLLFILIRIYS